ncbi:MAG: ribonuclease E/G [Lachnospiraceae bacterium]|nr:ribonuclease E/G [Lachnospiraceae bacterium]
MNRLVITELPLRDRGPFLFAGIFSDLVLLEAELVKAGKESLVGNIYAARVKGVHQGTKSAFLSLDGVHRGFLPLTKLNGAVFTKKVSKKPLVQGEELLVRVLKDAHQNKDYSVSVKLPPSFPEEWRTAGAETLLYREKPWYVRRLLHDPPETYAEVVTDLPAVYEATRALHENVRLYMDDYPLKVVYNIEGQLDRALQKKVYLGSGAFLTIEQTEGLVAVDVNSAKNTRKLEKEELLLSINREAAKELFRQLRLRNLSGMIVCDFIHMEEKNQSTLAEELKRMARAQTVQTEFVDFTGLGLAEFRRKRVRRTIAEQIFEEE